MSEDWTRMVAIGKGVGAGIRGGLVHVVAGSLFAQIERERGDGPRWVEAVRGSRRLRERAVGLTVGDVGNPCPLCGRPLDPGEWDAGPECENPDCTWGRSVST